MWIIPVAFFAMLAIGAAGGWGVSCFVRIPKWRWALLALWLLAPFLYLAILATLDPVCRASAHDLSNQLDCDEWGAFIVLMVIGAGPLWLISILTGVLIAATRGSAR
jgi:hypothetical protein